MHCAFQDAAFSIAYSEHDAAIVAAASSTRAKIQEALGDDQGAALHLSQVRLHKKRDHFSKQKKKTIQAIECNLDDGLELEQWMDCILDRLPESARIAYLHRQREGLKEWLAFEEERQKPLILQKLPKVLFRQSWLLLAIMIAPSTTGITNG